MTQPAIPTLEYATPPIRSRRWFYFLDFIIVSVFIGGLSFCLLQWVRRFSAVFSDFKTSLPLPTEFLLDISEAFCHDYLWLAAIAIPFIAPLPIARLRRRYSCDGRSPSTVVFIVAEISLVVGLLGIAYALVGYCLMSAVLKLIQSVST